VGKEEGFEGYRLKLYGTLGFLALYEMNKNGEQIIFNEDGEVVTVRKSSKEFVTDTTK
jgi:hypothetical protein